MGFASREALQNLFLSGIFRKTVTMTFPEIGAAPDMPPEAVVADLDGNPIGECWTSDLEELVTFGEKEFANTGRKNPNLPVVQWALLAMKTVRKDTQTWQQRMENPPSAQIIPFPVIPRHLKIQDNQFV